MFVFFRYIVNQTESADPSASSHTENISRSETEKNTEAVPAISEDSFVNNSDQEVKSRMYQWKDEKGVIQYTQEPPQEREYEEIEIVTAKGEERYSPVTASPYSNSSSGQTKQKTNRTTSVSNSPTKIELSSRCKRSYSRVEQLERKVANSKNIVDSIWLQDYCSALSEFIHEGCVLPKSEVTYNSYCPVRFRR
ncbi:DUF4124 domain-containing protein [Aliikangiella sp. G2MR2-5]|uniref:DUF4124 domain-containing protein n=1 Tax=Aliikangiella sp. G2MR2-5 TaxID=2788943 RepID=UPI0018AC124B|nr:DUF4124 domain-containing protein [Aliikangiella sp. G2MR2-5]